MAWLNNGTAAPKFQMITLDTDVVIIEHPGEDNEIIRHRYNGNSRIRMTQAADIIREAEWLSAREKESAFFWMGYFYAHLSS